MTRAVEAANDTLALKKCVYWQTEKRAKSGGKQKAEKGKANHGRQGDLTKDLGRTSRGNERHLRGLKQDGSINKLLF